jgi:ABC-type antimicrobial peptide transport system permease subunit
MFGMNAIDKAKAYVQDKLNAAGDRLEEIAINRYGAAKGTGIGGKNQVEGVTMFVIGILMIFVLFPVALGVYYNQSTDGWSGPVSALWGLLPLFAIIGGLLMIISGALHAAGKI